MGESAGGMGVAACPVDVARGGEQLRVSESVPVDGELVGIPSCVLRVGDASVGEREGEAFVHDVLAFGALGCVDESGELHIGHCGVDDGEDDCVADAETVLDVIGDAVDAVFADGLADARGVDMPGAGRDGHDALLNGCCLLFSPCLRRAPDRTRAPPARKPDISDRVACGGLARGRDARYRLGLPKTRGTRAAPGGPRKRTIRSRGLFAARLLQGAGHARSFSRPCPDRVEQLQSSLVIRWWDGRARRAWPSPAAR